MSTKKTLKFNVRQDGTVTEEVLGNVGNACENLTAEIEKRLGAVTQRVHKAESVSYTHLTLPTKA